VAGQTAVAAADGSYSLTVQLPLDAFGTVSAKTRDWWNIDSDEVWCYVR
jgi:hypothetical protein